MLNDPSAFCLMVPAAAVATDVEPSPHGIVAVYSDVVAAGDASPRVAPVALVSCLSAPVAGGWRVTVADSSRTLIGALLLSWAPPTSWTRTEKVRLLASSP